MLRTRYENMNGDKVENKSFEWQLNLKELFDQYCAVWCCDDCINDNTSPPYFYNEKDITSDIIDHTFNYSKQFEQFKIRILKNENDSKEKNKKNKKNKNKKGIKTWVPQYKIEHTETFYRWLMKIRNSFCQCLDSVDNNKQDKQDKQNKQNKHSNNHRIDDHRHTGNYSTSTSYTQNTDLEQKMEMEMETSKTPFPLTKKLFEELNMNYNDYLQFSRKQNNLKRMIDKFDNEFENVTIDKLRNNDIILIVANSGVGKTSLLRYLKRKYSKNFIYLLENDIKWKNNECILTKLGKNGNNAIELCSSIGLNSVPTWLKPFYVLSQGEQYRAILARLLKKASKYRNEKDLFILLDEFTGVLDRDTARCVALSLSKYVRKENKQALMTTTSISNGKTICPLVLASANYDIIPYLQPSLLIQLTNKDENGMNKINIQFINNPNINASCFANYNNDSLLDLKAVVDMEKLDQQWDEFKSTKNYKTSATTSVSRINRFGHLNCFKIIDLDNNKADLMSSFVNCDKYTSLASQVFDVTFNGRIYTRITSINANDCQWIFEDNIFEIGIIVGESGSGKTRTAIKHFGGLNNVYKQPLWDNKHCNILDHFPSLGDAVNVFKAVSLPIELGLKKYNQLSKGECERINIARKLIECKRMSETLVDLEQRLGIRMGCKNCKYHIFEEFTSFLDRKTAMEVMQGVNKYVAENNLKYVVLLACHEDILNESMYSNDNLTCVDWIVDLNTSQIYLLKDPNKMNESDDQEVKFNENVNVNVNSTNEATDASIKDSIKQMNEKYDNLEQLIANMASTTGLKFNTCIQTNKTDELFSIPKIRLYLKPTTKHLFESTFAKHHYLTAKISDFSKCFEISAEFNINYISDDSDSNRNTIKKLVGFCAVLKHPFIAQAFDCREHRSVVLPSFQGLGIGSTMCDAIAEYIAQTKCQSFKSFSILHSKTAHPRYGKYRNKSPLWIASQSNGKKSRIKPWDRVDHPASGNNKSNSNSNKHTSNGKPISNYQSKIFYSHHYKSPKKRTKQEQKYLENRVIVKMYAQ